MSTAKDRPAANWALRAAERRERSDGRPAALCGRGETEETVAVPVVAEAMKGSTEREVGEGRAASAEVVAEFVVIRVRVFKGHCLPSSSKATAVGAAVGMAVGTAEGSPRLRIS